MKHALTSAALGIFLVTGCSTTTQRQQAVIDEAVSLVSSWPADGPNRASAKAKFLADAGPYQSPAPAPTPTAAPSAK